MHKIGNLAAGTPVFRPVRWTTAAAANDDYSPDTFPSTLFRTSTTKRFCAFTFNSQHSHLALQWPQKLPLRPRWYVHLATLSTPKRANSTDCTTLIHRTSPAYTHHSVSEGVRPSLPTTSINPDFGWVVQRPSQRCRHSASATRRPSASQVNLTPNRRPST